MIMFLFGFSAAVSLLVVLLAWRGTRSPREARHLAVLAMERDLAICKVVDLHADLLLRLAVRQEAIGADALVQVYNLRAGRTAAMQTYFDAVVEHHEGRRK